MNARIDVPVRSSLLRALVRTVDRVSPAARGSRPGLRVTASPRLAATAATVFGERVRPGPGAIFAVMTALSGLFLLRVIGQVLVTYGGVSWLPEKAHWQSGLLPYPVLLASQVVILTVMAGIARDTWRGFGRFIAPRPGLSHYLRIASVVYFAAMVVRYVVTMALHPDWFPFEHSIPTFFHCLLASYLFLYSALLAGGVGSSDSRSSFASVARRQARTPRTSLRTRLAPYLPWTDGTGRTVGSWRYLPVVVACSVGYLILSWLLFVPLSYDDGGGKYRIDEERVDPYIYRIPDLSEDFFHALRSLLTAPFLNHDGLQLIYVTLLMLLFGVIFEIREGPRTTVLVFFGSTFFAAIFGGVVLHLIYPELWGASFLERAWERTWSGGSAGCFGLMGGLAARARKPWLLLGIFGLWEVFIEYVNLRSYTTVFHFAALFAGFVAVRYLIPPRIRTRG